MSPLDVVTYAVSFLLVCANAANADEAPPIDLAPPTADQYRHLLANLYNSNGSFAQLLQPASSQPPCSQLTKETDQKLCHSASQCLSTERLNAVMKDQASDDPDTILSQLCPTLLFQHRIPGCVSPDSDSAHSTGRRKPRAIEVWGYGLLFVTVINLLSVLAVLLLPLIGQKRFDSLMPSMIGLAAGSLAATALFYLIPDAFALSPAPGDHRYLNTALVVLLGSWIFFMLERSMKLVLDHKMRRSGDLSVKVNGESVLDSGSSCSSGLVKDGPDQVTSEVAGVTGATSQAIRSSFGQVDEKPRSAHQHTRDLARRSHGSGTSQGGIATVAWMIIFGDSLHNLLDGLSIGAAFSDNVLTGISVSLAIICEELPHELGDFAVLLESGMTVKQAVFYNFSSACTCYVGLVLGVLIGDFTESATYIFGLAGGMFLYISLVDMVPEMNEAAEKASAISLSRGLYIILLQNIGIFIGCFTLYSLAYYESSFHFEF